MNKFFLFFTLAFLFYQSIFCQTLISSQFLGHVSKNQLEQQFVQTFHNGVNRYRVTYETKDLENNSTVVSGLICLPADLSKRYPVLCYQHGTSGTDAEVPSNLGFDAAFPIALCGKGYVTFAPDYLGLGVSQGIHPYVHAASEAWVAADMLYATYDFAAQKNVAVNDQVFITGYSQGGHAAMALHRMLEQQQPGTFTVTASAPMSGPYSIGEVMRDLILSGNTYSRPGYLINTLVSYQHVYGDIFTNIDEAFNPAYQDLVHQFFNEEISLSEMDIELSALLLEQEGAIIPVKVLRPSYVDQIISDPNHPANLRMVQNNTYDWAPAAPTRLFYCMADEQVPFENSTLAAAVMQDNGAADVLAVNISSTADHSSCAFSAALTMINFFADYQEIDDLPVASNETRTTDMEVTPNPASESLFLRHLPSAGEVRILNLQGQIVYRTEVQPGSTEISVHSLAAGVYLLDFTGGPFSFRRKILLQ